MTQANGLLARLLAQGDKVFIEKGRLVIQPNSGKDVPADFLKRNSRSIITDILLLVDKEAYSYLEYNTGHYGKHKSAGITIQFNQWLTGENHYTIFNVNLKRLRNAGKHKKGDAMPKRQFSVSKRHDFYKFWLSTGLPIPTSTTRFYERMGKLKDVALVAEVSFEARLKSSTLQPLNLDYEVILAAHKIRIVSAYPAHKKRIIPAHKEMAQSHVQQASQTNQTTYDGKYGYKAIRTYGDKGALSLGIPPTDQTIDEWLNDYDNTPYLGS